MDANDITTLRMLDHSMTPYEQFKVQNMQARNHTSGIGVAGLVLGTVGTAIGVGAWLFGGMYGNAKANQAKETAAAAKEVTMAYISGIDKRLDNVGALLESEVTRRIQGDQTITQTITDTVSGSQQGTLTAQQAAELSAIQTATNTVTAGLMTGQYSQNPMRVVRVSGTRECGCDGCGCNG